MSAAGLRKLLLSAIVAGTSVAACAQTPEYEAHPREFVRVATYNELHSRTDGERFMWKDTDRKPKGSTTKIVVETKQGAISRMIAINGHPLDQQERAQDDGRVNRLLTDPSALRKKQQEQHDDEQHSQRLLASIPDAFLFKYVGIAELKNGKAAHYTFSPDPNFNPPNHETRVLTGMKGDLYVDLDAKRIAKIDATLFQSVDFGWGILGRLDKGGHFLIEQTCIGGPRWETTHSVLHFTGKIMMFKALNIQEDETLYDFRHVSPDLTLAQGIAVMKRADDVVAENGGGNGQR